MPAHQHGCRINRSSHPGTFINPNPVRGEPVEPQSNFNGRINRSSHLGTFINPNPVRGEPVEPQSIDSAIEYVEFE